MIIRVRGRKKESGINEQDITAVNYGLNVSIEITPKERKILLNYGLSNAAYGGIAIPNKLLYSLYTSNPIDYKDYNPNSHIRTWDVFGDAYIQQFFKDKKIAVRWNKELSTKFAKNISDYVKETIKEVKKPKKEQEVWTTEYHSILDDSEIIPKYSVSDEAPINLDQEVEMRIGTMFYSLIPNKKGRTYKTLLGRVKGDLKNKGKIDRENLNKLATIVSSEQGSIIDDLRRRLKCIKNMPDLSIDQLIMSGVQLYSNNGESIIHYVFPFKLEIGFIKLFSDELAIMKKPIVRDCKIDLGVRGNKISSCYLKTKDLQSAQPSFHSHTGSGQLCMGTMHTKDLMFDTFEKLLVIVQNIQDMMKIINTQSWLTGTLSQDNEMADLYEVLSTSKSRVSEGGGSYDLAKFVKAGIINDKVKDVIKNTSKWVSKEGETGEDDKNDEDDFDDDYEEDDED